MWHFALTETWHWPVEVAVGELQSVSYWSGGRRVTWNHRALYSRCGWERSCPACALRELLGGWDLRSCVFCVFLCSSVQLDAVFSVRLAFPADKITHKQMWNSFYAQIVPLIRTSITLEQTHIFKISFQAELAVVYFILKLSPFSFLPFHCYWFLNLYLS